MANRRLWDSGKEKKERRKEERRREGREEREEEHGKPLGAVKGPQQLELLRGR